MADPHGEAIEEARWNMENDNADSISAALVALADRRCETCVHWSDDWDGWTATPQLYEGGDPVTTGDDYEPVLAPGRWGHCKKAGEFGPEKADRFFVVDGSEYKADLHTRSDFGCVEWTEK